MRHFVAVIILLLLSAEAWAQSGATGSNVPTSASYVGGSVSGTMRGVTLTNPAGSQYGFDVNIASYGGQLPDPCRVNPKVRTSISVTSNTQLITGTAAKNTYFCGLVLSAGAATNVAIVNGTGSVCGSGTSGPMGGSTAATGFQFAANGGLVIPTGDAFAASTTTGDNTCIFVSASNQISGVMVTVVAP